jgi:hypothetical protein
VGTDNRMDERQSVVFHKTIKENNCAISHCQ